MKMLKMLHFTGGLLVATFIAICYKTKCLNETYTTKSVAQNPLPIVKNVTTRTLTFPSIQGGDKTCNSQKISMQGFIRTKAVSRESDPFGRPVFEGVHAEIWSSTEDMHFERVQTYLDIETELVSKFFSQFKEPLKAVNGLNGSFVTLTGWVYVWEKEEVFQTAQSLGVFFPEEFSFRYSDVNSETLAPWHTSPLLHDVTVEFADYENFVSDYQEYFKTHFQNGLMHTPANPFGD